MNDDVKKIIGESYKRLPFDLKKAIVSGETRQRMQMIAEKHRLSSDQATDLEIETALVMLGLRSPADLITNIKNALIVPAEKARAIAEDINTEIFRPIRESLKKIHGIIGEGNLEKVTPSPAPVIPKPPAPVPPPPKQEIASLAFQKKELPKPATVIENIKLAIPEKPEKEKTPTERTVPGGHFENGENHLSREEILAGIENPVPTKPTAPVTANIVQEKLSGVVRMPRTEREIKGYEVDPYREPLK